MSFREFISSFRYRRRLAKAFERFENIRPPASPSRRYIDKLVRRLLDARSAALAQRELEMIGRPAVPSLVAALNDPRFLLAEWEPSTPAPLESTLELLVEHAGDEVVRVASALVKSASAEVRKTVALQIASTGRADAMPLLRELMGDDDGYVRSYVAIGIRRAVSEGRTDDAFRRDAYNLLLVQCDQKWGNATNDSMEVVALLDPERAAVDLADERWLRLANPNLHRLLDACNAAGILLPEAPLRQMLAAALPLAIGDRCYPNQYVAAAALRALAMRHAEGVEQLARRLLDHEHKTVKEAAGEAMTVLAGMVDPVEFVLHRVNAHGYEALSHEQRVVYCAFLFDSEVRNGGLMQFFGNSSGDHAADTLEALAQLQHAEAQTALAAAIRLVGPLALEPDRELRLTGFEGRWDELQPAFDPLEAAYYRAQRPLRQAWLLYAARNAEQFRR